MRFSPVPSSKNQQKTQLKTAVKTAKTAKTAKTCQKWVHVSYIKFLPYFGRGIHRSYNEHTNLGAKTCKKTRKLPKKTLKTANFGQFWKSVFEKCKK